MNPRSDDSRAQSPRIVGIRPWIDRVFIYLNCRVCEQDFQNHQLTIAGVPIGRHFCPLCNTLYEVLPEDFQKALDRCLPVRDMKDAVSIAEEATRIVETWYKSEPFKELLTYRGVNLGEPSERELFPLISLGLYATQPPEENSA